MAPRSQPRVKHRSSINSKGLKNNVEHLQAGKIRKHKKGREPALKSTWSLFGKADVGGSLNRCAAAADEKCISEAFPEIGCKVWNDCTSGAHAGGEAGGGTRGQRISFRSQKDVSGGLSSHTASELPRNYCGKRRYAVHEHTPDI